MRVHVEWIDGVKRTYDGVGQTHLSSESNLLTLHGHRVGGYSQHIASIPLDQVREYRKEE
ncbi:hypothetical protein [Micromonospora aurantiaca (nom. illeg.)]|uniref:hypothetical protein n=1 Tax=Micromonospora aurantiaca (nom. illeg.) TaxID=47850 RepID=UPI0033DED7CD